MVNSSVEWEMTFVLERHKQDGNTKLLRMIALDETVDTTERVEVHTRGARELLTRYHGYTCVETIDHAIETSSKSKPTGSDGVGKMEKRKAKKAKTTKPRKSTKNTSAKRA